MKKLYYVFADWRKSDIDFLNTLKKSNKITKGCDSFSIEEGEDYDRFLDYYSKKDSLFKKTRPPEFRIQHASCIFSQEDLDNAKYYVIPSLAKDESTEKLRPDKEERFFSGTKVTFAEERLSYLYDKKQIAPFSIKRHKWKKDELAFNIQQSFDYVCFKKDFFDEVLAPLGLKSREVLDYATGLPLEDTVQLVIPMAKSKLLLEGSAYDIPISKTNGYKEYSVQTLDFFPPFEKEFPFTICHSQENFEVHKKIIITKEFCDLLISHKVIDANREGLIPLSNE